MKVFRRTLVLLVLAGSCEGGPTSDWPARGSGEDDGANTPSAAADAGSVGSLDAGTALRDAAVPVSSTGDCLVDAGDAGADAGCAVRDE